MTTLSATYQSLVHNHNDQVTTTSKIVADTFGKLHKDVLRKIDQIISETPVEFNERNFTPIEMSVKVGFGMRSERAFEITKDGFMLLVMGFTGKKAMALKIEFINAFNWMYEQLQSAKTTAEQRTPLRQACDRLAVNNMLISDAYKMVSEHYGVEGIDQIPVDKLPEAVAYVYEVALKLKSTSTLSEAVRLNTQSLVTNVFYINSWFKAVRGPLAALNPLLVKEVSGHMINGVFTAGILNSQLQIGFDTTISNAHQWSVGKV